MGVDPAPRRAVQAAVPEATVLPVRSLTEVLDQAPSMFLRRYPVFLLGVFAAFALLLAAVGIFGVVSYAVVQRTREFGIRMAVGAARKDILRLVLRHNLPPVFAGAVAGVVGLVALAIVFRGLLFVPYGFGPGGARAEWSWCWAWWRCCQRAAPGAPGPHGWIQRRPSAPPEVFVQARRSRRSAHGSTPEQWPYWAHPPCCCNRSSGRARASHHRASRHRPPRHRAPHRLAAAAPHRAAAANPSAR